MKLRYTGKTGFRRVNGRPLRNDEVFEVPDKDAVYMLTLPDIESADGGPTGTETTAEVDVPDLGE